MSLEIPLLGDTPATFTSRAIAPQLERLARNMAANGFMTAADLRIGTGGPRRLVEKPFHRWWDERGLSRIGFRTLPLRLHVLSGSDWDEVPIDGRQDAWLVVDSRSWTRCYLHPLLRHLQKRPAGCAHVLAVTYFALDSVCYSIKPPDMLRLARAYWWGGRDDEKQARARGDHVMSRRQFDNRVPRITQAPVYDRGAMNSISGSSALKRAVDNVDRWMRDPRILRPNAHRLTGRHPASLAIALRCRHGDPAPRLVDDHWHHMEEGQGVYFQSAWRVPGGRAPFQRLLDRIEATARLVGAIEHLIETACWTARGHYYG